MAGVFVKPELENRVGAVPSDVRHEGKLVGWVGLHRVGTSGCFQPFDGWASYRSVSPERLDRCTGTFPPQSVWLAISCHDRGTGGTER